MFDEELEEKCDLFPDKSGHSLGDIIDTILVQLFWAKVLEKTEQIGVPFPHRSMLLCLYLLFDLLLSAFFFCYPFLYEQISKSLMVTGEYISGNKGEIFHLRTVALMHGAFEADVDEFLSEGGVLNAVLDEDFHVDFDFSVDVRDAEHLL